MAGRDFSASWRKKDSQKRFMRPTDSETFDLKKDCNDEVRKQEPATDVKPQLVSRTSETAHSQTRARKPAEPCNYAYVFNVNDYYFYYCIL